MSSNARGGRSGDSAQTGDSVDSGQSEEIDDGLTAHGVSDRETPTDVTAKKGRRAGGGGGGGGI